MKMYQNMLRNEMAVALVLATGILFTACQKNDLAENAVNSELKDEVLSSAAPSASSREVPNEMLVKFKPGTSVEQRNRALSGLQADVKERIFTRAMESAGEKDGIYLLRIPVDVLTGVARAKAFSEIEYAEPNYIYSHQAVSNDPYYTGGSLWGMYGASTSPANSFGIGAGVKWASNYTGASTVVVGIIDEGYMHTHTDLRDNAWVNPNETVDGRDNDGNGYIDDIRGWDFVRNDNTTYDGAADDHGTHVAGTIGAKGGNGTGVAGVCWNVKMISGKFLGTSGGTTANAVKAVDYFTDLKTKRGVNIVATNNSWGGGGYSSTLYNAIQRANSAGILFIAAAGNAGSNNDASPAYPASYNNSNIIAVASITNTGARSSFSNYGATTVDIGAPGSSINSTLPSSSGSSSYGAYSGTSMATPHVTGAAALYKSMYSSATASQIKSAIMSKSVPTSSLSGRCVSGGRLSVSGF